MMPAPQIAMAWPCSSGLLMLRSTVWDRGTSAAPHRPWNRRKAIISSRLVESPQAMEAMTKPAAEAMKSWRRPILSDSQPVTGVMIAAATI